ncbi:MAG: glutamate synthase large subunit [Acidobacteria bacterium]|nr:glutamate synthase large subunit [Acidobacteriota bacterium]
MPPARGLYDPRFEHDACGVSFVVDVHGRASHRILSMGLGALCSMEHRGATGAEPDTGDGAGVLLQVPHGFLEAVAGVPLPAPGRYGTGIAFLPADPGRRRAAVEGVERIVREEGLEVLGWREVPVDPSALGATARAAMPAFAQVFVADPRGAEGVALDRLLWVARKRTEHELTGDLATYFPSLSCRTLVYKGMLTTPQLGAFFPDLSDPRMETALALVHSRFSTNTFPSWPLAHPYRYVAHNGEINTVQGNRNWMRTRESLLQSDLIPGLPRALPVVTPGGSDSMSLDEVLELLHLGGRSLPHAVMMMIPEAWENDGAMDPARRDFYRFHAALMEPWDGPAAVSFTDGTVIGAVLDRNGLRPGRWCETSDGLVVLASETGVVDIDPATVVRKGRLQPGRMFLVDTSKGRIVEDDEIKAELAASQPWGEWLRDGMVSLRDLPAREHVVHSRDSVLRRQQVFGWTSEDLKLIVAPMARSGAEPIGSMGTDTPIAVLSTRPRLLFDYFQQLFAQVTNPPLDAIREEVVTSVGTSVGPEGNLLAPGPDSCRQLTLPYPVINNDNLAKILHIDDDGTMGHLRSATVGCLYRVADGGAGLREALDRVCAEASAAIAGGARIVVLSDRNSDEVWAPIPSLLSTAAVHHHLIRGQVRTRAGLVVECGDAREVHHMALLIGYGAGAINPYLAFETIEHMILGDGDADADDAGGAHGLAGLDPAKAVTNYLKAAGKGVLKVMSKMGVSTVASYTGAQIFEAIGIGREVIDRYFTGTVSRIGGIGLDEIAAEVAARHAVAHPRRAGQRLHRRLEAGGEYQWRREGELHLFNPETVYRLQHATRSGRYDLFRQYTRAVDDQSRNLCTLRGLFGLVPVGEPVPIDEVEPVSSIVRRFSTGAMSYGSISAEAHETLAIAMNRLGAKSNTGEGGEDPERNVPLPNGDSRRSAIKQVASGRFGVTSEYLVNADDLQIKMAQGAKPGEGGQLPGHKVYPWIARTRHSTPGVGLISPPPHHDIYSIEDLKQLIHDLKNANRHSRVHVKLVAEVGVGTVAAGVSKARADVVLISGHDGGTGASPLTSLKHAGAPWELGLAEAQQVLVMNGLRDRIVVQADGQMKTGRDVVVAALLGAEEFGFATAPLVVSGCVMMRVCHLDTCPVGVATQNPELRRRFTGKPEFVVNFFEFIAQEVREHLAALGFRSLEEAVGRTEALDVQPAVDHWKAAGLDLSPILVAPDNRYGRPVRHATAQDHGLEHALDRTMIRRAAPAIEFGQPVEIESTVANVHRTVGTMLGSEITRFYGGAGLPDDTIRIRLTGSAGQSLGAFLPRGITISLEGDANDYVAKGLSGGIVALRPDRRAAFAPEDNVIAGNVIGYGATSGRLFVSGRVGERFCVRNSGATAVVEGTGDHGCEYMTGGRVVVLGRTGRNFAAGMSGGTAFLHDPDGTAASRVNGEMVDVVPVADDDREWLRDTVAEHVARTGSPLAQRLLAAWDAAPFVMVLPRDYARVLAIAEEARREGLGDDAVAARIMERVNG